MTDTLPVAEDRTFDKLEVLSVAKIIADAIDAVFEDTSVSELFGGRQPGLIGRVRRPRSWRRPSRLGPGRASAGSPFRGYAGRPFAGGRSRRPCRTALRHLRRSVMAEVILAAEVGRPIGSRAVRRLRREGKIPGVIYGHGTDPRPGRGRGPRAARSPSTARPGANQLLSLDTGSSTYLTLAREMQRHPVAQTVTHVDFLIVRRDEVIAADVPITLVGEALEVHHGDGLVDQQMFTLAIKARPADIPTSLEVDISDADHRRPGPGLRPRRCPTGVTTDVDPETAIAIGQPPRVVARSRRRAKARAKRSRRAAEPRRRGGRGARRGGLGPAPHLSPGPSAGGRRRTCWSSGWAIPEPSSPGRLHNAGCRRRGAAGQPARRLPASARRACGRARARCRSGTRAWRWPSPPPT